MASSREVARLSVNRLSGERLVEAAETEEPLDSLGPARAPA
eukprot:CAMPEP_0182883540 /NCGR_PEP_ID=MMETSP0034_2-20130328/18443_1 /TAXON_ID=156128 /ORGANISM="Nephroselmis pyriformis, Strain CCMP717" /LENGTH=40 /DNA_ID= /DNA_START= /DNA_END= /DNA_ORIENTATION=